MKNISVQVEDELWRGVRRKSFDAGVTLTEVVTSLLRTYVEEPTRFVAPKVTAIVDDPAILAPRSASSSEKLYARAGCPHKIPQGVRCEKPYGCGAVHQP